MDATMNIKKRAAILLAAAGLMLSLGAGTALASNLVGGPGPDTLRGTPQNDVLRGFDGNDRLFGEGDSDLMYGGSGKDRLVGGDDSDLLVGGADNDVIDAVDFKEDGRPEGDRINCGPGIDTVRASVGEDIIAANCERVISG